MPLTDILKDQIRRLVPHEGMVIDVSSWNAAHEYHTMQGRLHSMAMHNAGLVNGLEVVAWDPPDTSVVINPGIALDEDGRTIVVREPQRFQLQVEEAGTLYLVLQYREVSGDGQSSGGSSDSSESRYALEAYRLEERRQLPDEPYIELARIQVSGSNALITEPTEPQNPSPDEIDSRYRVASGPRPLGSVRIGVVPLETTEDGQVAHATGAMSLARAISTTTRYRAEFTGPVNLGQEIENHDLVIMAGGQEFTLTDEWVAVLKNFLDRGGFLFGETCGANGDSGAASFQQSFIELAQQLGGDLNNVERGHAILTAYHLFARPPEGIGERSLLAASNGVAFSDADYGCLWDGGAQDNPASREAIRSATEMGVNIGVYASQRVHARSAKLAAQ